MVISMEKQFIGDPSVMDEIGVEEVFDDSIIEEVFDDSRISKNEFSNSSETKKPI